MKRFSIFLTIAVAFLFSMNTFAQMTSIQGTVSNIPSGSSVTLNGYLTTPGGTPFSYSTLTDSSGFYSFSNLDIDSLMQFQTNIFTVYLIDCNGDTLQQSAQGVINPGGIATLDFDYCPCSASFTFNQTDPNTQNFTPNQAWLVDGSTGTNLTYMWDFGDGTTGTGLNLSHAYTGNGPYTLCLTVDNGAGCSSTFCDTLSVDPITGVISKLADGFTVHIGDGNLGTIEIETPVLTVYPNPVSDVLFLQLDIEVLDNVTYSLTDLNGRTIIREQLNGSTAQIDVSTLASGTYIVKVQDQKNSLIQKITIE